MAPRARKRSDRLDWASRSTPTWSRNVAERRVISGVERRRRLLSNEEWRLLEASDGFWQLADAGYVSYRRAAADRHEVVGHKYVGRAVFGELELQVREKVPGTLHALIGFATGSNLRVEDADSPATDPELVSRHLMDEFTREAGHYIADRRNPRYRYRDATGPVLAGTLDMPATMRLHASGRLGLFAYRRGAVVRDEPLDRLVLAALGELDRAAPALHLNPRTIYDARWLAATLEEVRDEPFLATSTADFLALSSKIEGDPAALPEDADLARLAAVALMHRGFEPDLAGDGEVPRAWFVDLETLFEQAVRETLGVLLPTHEVDKGEAYERRVFAGGIDSSRANPDIVIHEGLAIRAAGDVKYKTLGSTSSEVGEETHPRGRKRESRSDLYQLLVHSASLGVDRAFLIYAGDGAPSYRYLGLSATHCHTWAAEIRPTHLLDDLDWFLRESGAVEERLAPLGGDELQVLATPMNALAE